MNETQEQKILECNHKWTETYYGVTCDLCGLFVPDGCGWWLPSDDDNEDYRSEEYYPDEPYPEDDCPAKAG